MKAKIIIALAIFSATAFTASAQTAPAAKAASTLPADNRRIHNGRKSGELTNAEALRLKAQERRVRQERKDYRQDGTVSAAERKDLRKDKKRLSKNIYKQKHDAQTKPY